MEIGEYGELVHPWAPVSISEIETEVFLESWYIVLEKC